MNKKSELPINKSRRSGDVGCIELKIIT